MVKRIEKFISGENIIEDTNGRKNVLKQLFNWRRFVSFTFEMTALHIRFPVITAHM